MKMKFKIIILTVFALIFSSSASFAYWSLQMEVRGSKSNQIGIVSVGKFAEPVFHSMSMMSYFDQEVHYEMLADMDEAIEEIEEIEDIEQGSDEEALVEQEFDESEVV